MSFSAASRIIARSARQMAVRRLPTVSMASKMIAPRASMNATRAFSVTAFKNQKSAADAQLLSVLKTEIDIEKADEIYAANLESNLKFINSRGFEIIMKDGRDEVQLIKKDGGETIHVFFSVSDVTNADTYDFQDDPEEISEIEGAPEESLMNGDITPIRANIVIEKSSGGALGIECVSQDNLLIIENITPYESADVALANSAENDYQRRSVFQGPSFSDLDESLQAAIEKYLASKGIDAGLSSFISEFSTDRENREYIIWLNNLKSFVEA